MEHQNTEGVDTQITVAEKKKYTYRPSPKNKLFMELWTNPSSETFGNVYQSGIKAGFRKSYAQNLMNVAPKWLLSYMEKTDFTKDHIKQLLQGLALEAPNSRSPDDSRLKAIELLMKALGMIDQKNIGATVNIVQPILGGRSVVQAKSSHQVIDIDTTN